VCACARVYMCLCVVDVMTVCVCVCMCAVSEIVPAEEVCTRQSALSDHHSRCVSSSVWHEHLRVYGDR
jgi:hypothetical protein